MDKVPGRLTVFFGQPFWIGVFERISEGMLSVCKVTFGTEPKDYEIYDFVRNPKRVQREVRKQVRNTGRYKIATGFEITTGEVENWT